MTIADKIRRCTDEELAKFLHSLYQAIQATEIECEELIDEGKLFSILQKPLIPDTLKQWTDSLEALDEKS